MKKRSNMISQKWSSHALDHYITLIGSGIQQIQWYHLRVPTATASDHNCIYNVSNLALRFAASSHVALSQHLQSFPVVTARFRSSEREWSEWVSDWLTNVCEGYQSTPSDTHCAAVQPSCPHRIVEWQSWTCMCCDSAPLPCDEISTECRQSLTRSAGCTHPADDHPNQRTSYSAALLSMS